MAEKVLDSLASIIIIIIFYQKGAINKSAFVHH